MKITQRWHIGLAIFVLALALVVIGVSFMRQAHGF